MPFYHQFNKFTGRLQNSAKFQPLNPVTPVPLQRTEPTTMIWDSIKTKAVKSVIEKPKAFSTLPPKIKAQMEHFQKDMTKPVYLMGGTKDKVLFGITIALMGYLLYEEAKFFGPYIWKK